MSFFEITGDDYLGLLKSRLEGQVPELTWLQQCRDLVSHYLTPGVAILDIGCATGYAYKSIGRPDINYLGIDVEERFLALARDHYRKCANIEFALHDISQAPLPSTLLLKPADIVVCSAIIEHFPTLSPAIDHIIQATGKCLFLRTFLSEHEELHSIPSPVQQFAGEHRKFSNSYSFRSVLTRLGNAGFRVRTIRDRYTDSMPYYIDGSVRTFYIVLAERP